MSGMNKSALYLENYSKKHPEAWPTAADEFFLYAFGFFYITYNLYIIQKDLHLRSFSKVYKTAGMPALYQISLFSILLSLLSLFVLWSITSDSRYVHSALSLLFSIGVPLFLLGLMFYPYALQLGFAVKLSPEFSLKKYTRSRLAKVNLVDLEYKLHDLMENKNIFKEENLNLPELAKLTGLQVHQLSEYFNIIKGISYSNYIRKRRIDEAIRPMKYKNTFHFTRIAFECGFNSVSNFYEAFKKEKGMTPKEFVTTLIKNEKVI